jgi:hypothetical protein
MGRGVLPHSGEDSPFPWQLLPAMIFACGEWRCNG